MSTIDDLTVVGDFPETPGQCSPSDKQRLRIYIPNVKTTVSAGAPAPPGGMRGDHDAGAPNYSGFGVTTEGHVFISAHKDVASSTATMQAKGYVHIQSQDSQVWISGKQGAFLHASEQVVLNGGKGLLIGSGAMMDAPTNVEPDGADPKVPAWLEGSRQLASKTANMWGLIDMYAGGLEHALQVSDAALAIKHKQWADLLWILFQATITQLGSGVVKDNIMGGSMMPDKTDGSTIVYGDGGLVLGSGGSAGIYAKYGCSLSSLTFAGITAPWASLTGLRTVELRSVMKGMSLASGEEMQQVAKKSVEIASRSERVALKGKQLVLGSKSGAQQAETEVLAGYAQKAIGLASKGQMRLSSPNLGLSADNAVVNAKKLALNGKDKATLSGKEVAIKGGSTVSVSTDAYFLNIDGSSIKLGNVAKEIPAEPTPKPPDYEARIKLLAEDAPNAALRAMQEDEEKAWVDEWMAWADKAGAIEAKNCSIELKDGDITLEVKGFKFKIDSSATAVGNTLKIMK